MLQHPWLWCLNDQRSKTLWNPEHRQNSICFLVHYQYFLKILKSVCYFLTYFANKHARCHITSSLFTSQLYLQPQFGIGASKMNQGALNSWLKSKVPRVWCKTSCLLPTTGGSGKIIASNQTQACMWTCLIQRLRGHKTFQRQYVHYVHSPSLYIWAFMNNGNESQQLL